MKKRTITTVIACLLAVITAFAFVACDSNPSGPSATSVTLDVTSVTMGPGDTKRLTATVVMSDGSDAEVEWSTSDDKVATVIKGIISAKKAGTATITATAGGKSATCAVTVEDIAVTLDKTTLALERWTEGQLTATVKKNGAAVQEQVEWSSSDEQVVTVDATGKVTAVGEGEATVTAKRAGGNQNATATVTVNWTKPAGYKAMTADTEQNKVPAGEWGYWTDRGKWVGGMATMHEAYYQSSTEGSQAGKVNFTYTITERDDESKDRASIIQVTYRNAKSDDNPDGLEVNHDYELSMEIESSVAGVINLNTIDTLVPKEEKEDPTPIRINKGKTEVKVTFRHGDWGVIHPEGVYDNVESAVFLLLGMLGEPGEKVTVSVDKVKWVDKGESAKKTEKPDFSPPKAPDLSGVEAKAWTLASEDTEKYTITSKQEGKAYDVVYNTTTSTYETIDVDLASYETDKNNTFAITVKNNGTTDIALRFDLIGTTPTAVEGGEQNLLECVTKAAVVGGTANFNAQWGGTELVVKAGETATLYLTYECETHGKPVTLKIFFNTQYYNNEQVARSGNVTLGDFKFANVTEEE